MKEIIPDIHRVKHYTFLKMNAQYHFEFDQNDLTDYQTAFLILLNELEGDLFSKIHNRIDLFFDQHPEWNGISQSGIELPTDNSTKWKLLWQLSFSGNHGPMFHICFDGWEIENTYALENDKTLN